MHIFVVMNLCSTETPGHRAPDFDYPLRRHEQFNTTCWSTNFTHLANLTDLPLELRMVLRSIERTSDTGRTAIDRCVGRSADIEFGELIG